MFHDEMDHISSFSTAEAFTQSLAGRDAERGRFLVVERAQSDVVHSPSAKCDKFGYYIYYLCRIQYPVYGGLVYHIGMRK